MQRFAITAVLVLAATVAYGTSQLTNPTTVPLIKSVPSSQGTAAPEAGMTASTKPAEAPAAGDSSQVAELQARYDDLAGINHDLESQLDRLRTQVALFSFHKSAEQQPVAKLQPAVYQQRPTFSGYSACGPGGCAPSTQRRGLFGRR